MIIFLKSINHEKKELVEKLNWKIEVKSKVNVGSELIVSLPISETVAPNN